MTLEAWVWIPRLPQYDTVTQQPFRAIVVKGSPNQWEYGLYLTTNAQPVFSLWQANGSTYATVNAGLPLSLNQWHHLAGVVRKGQFACLFVDGVLVGETNSFSGDTSDRSSALYIGRRGDAQFFDGQVDELALYGRALASAEIAGIYQAGSAGKCMAIPGGAVPYTTDFESGAGSEWTLPVTVNSESRAFSRFSGRFNNTAQVLTLTNLVLGQRYTLGFDLYVIDSWEGGSAASSDYFDVHVNGSQVFHYTFANSTAAQTYPGTPDEGKAPLGFTPGQSDSVYRNIEISFFASNPLTVIHFTGQNLEAIDNESWGVDNVSVQLTAALPGTVIRSASLPGQGTTNAIALEGFTIAASAPLLAASAGNAANYTLRSAGADGQFSTADDVLHPFTVSLPGTGGRSVAFALQTLPLPPGRYRFQTGAGLTAADSGPVPVFTRDFVIVHPVAGGLETAGNDVIGNATPLPATESPTGSGFLTAFAVGAFSSTSDVDYWRFDAEAGDVITVRVEAEAEGVYPKLRLRNASDQDLSGAAVDGNYEGIAQRQTYTITTPGTYYLRVWSSNNSSRYWLRLDQSRGPELESEDNGSLAAADPVKLTLSPGLYQGRMAGALPMADTAGDYFNLGVLNVGNSINASILYPTGSTLTASQSIATVYRDGASLGLVTNLGSTLNYTVTGDGVHYVRLQTLDPGLRDQYLLNVTVSDGAPPVITAATLPAEGTATTSLVDRFALGFSEPIQSLSVSNRALYQLRGSGPDGVLDTADDSFYSVATTGYPAESLGSSYTILDGPLQPSQYRFTVSASLADRAGNPMAAPFTRSFSVGNLPGFTFESRTNDAPGRATVLSSNPGANGEGTISHAATIGTPSDPRFAVAAHFNTDTNLDVAIANWNGNNVAVYTNNGYGSFGVLTNIPTGVNPVGLATADFNQDAYPDLAVANYTAGTVTVLLGNPNGSFQIATNIGGFNQPYNLSATDLNSDGIADLVVPNHGASTITVLLGGASGSNFLIRSNYATGTNPQTVAAGDLNGDSLPDLAVANRGNSTITILTNTGNGTFLPVTNLPAPTTPRYVIIAELTGDALPDIASLQAGDNFVTVFAGIGNAAFQTGRSYFSGTTDTYQMSVADLNGDQRADLVIPGYGNNQIAVLLNNGSGSFTNLAVYATTQNPIG
ncbi:MAG TPA: FG-GAP-like repeat-containing protein, partial [Clostridia bacterium]|nr:FG-GAP-like repeat-containing protein [Clostridia bacterium]